VSNHGGSKQDRLEANIPVRADNFVRQFGLTIYRRLKSMDFYIYHSDIRRVCVEVLQEIIPQGKLISPKDLKAEVFNRLLEWQKEKARVKQTNPENEGNSVYVGTCYISTRRKVSKRSTY
jgi:hypothetical protein